MPRDEVLDNKRDSFASLFREKSIKSIKSAKSAIAGPGTFVDTAYNRLRSPTHSRDPNAQSITDILRRRQKRRSRLHPREIFEGDFAMQPVDEAESFNARPFSEDAARQTSADEESARGEDNQTESARDDEALPANASANSLSTAGDPVDIHVSHAHLRQPTKCRASSLSISSFGLRENIVSRCVRHCHLIVQT